MKKIFIIALFINCLMCNAFAEVDITVYQRAAEMIDRYWDDNYVESVKYKIGSNEIVVNGESKKVDTNNTDLVPMIIDGTSMIPIEMFEENFGAKLAFDVDNQTVNLQMDDIDMQMRIGSSEIKVLDEEKKTSSAPIIHSGSAFLPLRDVAENIGLEVTWNPDEKEIELINDLQLKRLIVEANEEIDFTQFDAIEYIDVGDNFYLVQFDTMGKTKKAYEKLKEMASVEYVEFDKIVLLDSNEEAQLSNYTYKSWGADRMNVSKYVEYLNNNNKKSEVVVAVLDTGIDLGHIMFYDRIKPGGINVTNNNSSVLTDTHGHGTHVAGTIAELTQGTNVKILPIKISKDKFSAYSWMSLAVDYAVKMKVDIVNLSYEHFGLSMFAYEKMINANILPVFAAGNDGKDISNANKSSKAIEVGAIDRNNQKAYFSNFGKTLDIVAPGVDIVSAKVGGGYISNSGTSMAAPHISAVAALYKVNNKNMTVSQLEKQLKDNVDDIGTSGKDSYFGYGVPNMAKAIYVGGGGNNCTTCYSPIKSSWYDDGAGNHYHQCQNGHKSSIGMHVDSNENLECDICNLSITTCYACKAKLKSGWYTATGDYENHYKVCVAGHSSYKKKHVDGNGDGKCDSCYTQIEKLCTVCKATLKRDKFWVNLDKGTHYIVCVSGHVNEEAMHVDKDEDTICEICWHNVSTCYVCKGRLKEGWLWNEAGNHYKECVNGHPSYIAKHKMNGGKCTVCSYLKESNNIGNSNKNGCARCGQNILSEWKNDEQGNHYKACVSGHMNQVGEHYDSNSDMKCEVCTLVIDTCYSCKSKLKAGWQYDSLGQHFKICENNHCSYIGKHNFQNNKCMICGFSKDEIEKPDNPIETMPLFSDLPKEHWAYNEVKAMVEAGIVKGKTDGSLGTDDPITVEEVVSLLAALADKKGLERTNGKTYLEDQINGWSKENYIKLMQVLGAKQVEETKELGKTEIQLLLGNKDSEVIANYKLPITREKIANFMGVFVEDEESNTNNILNAKDWNSVNSIYRARIIELAERNIFRGVKEPDGIYVKPNDNIKRVEAIALINRLYNTI